MVDSRIIIRTGIRLLALGKQQYHATVEEELEQRETWISYLSSMFPAIKAEEVFKEVEDLNASLVPIFAGLYRIEYECYKASSRPGEAGLKRATLLPRLDQVFYDLCKKLACAESIVESDMTSFWDIETEGFESLKELIGAQYEALENARKERALSAMTHNIFEGKMPERNAIDMVQSMSTRSVDDSPD
jgi:hypothetical protein